MDESIKIKLVYVMLYILATCILLIGVVPKIFPHVLFLKAVKQLIRNSTIRNYLTILGIILVVDVIESRYDAEFTKVLGWSFMPGLGEVEVKLIIFLQSLFSFPFAIHFFTFIYIYVFDAMIATALIIGAGTGDGSVMKRLAIVLAANYCIALPFYLFFPVSEAWYDTPSITLLVNSVNVNIMEFYRSTSALDNCFPSLHTAISLSLCWFLFTVRMKWAGYIMSFLTVLVIFSTLVLGIHWFMDITTGGILAFLAGVITNTLMGMEKSIESVESIAS